MFSDAVIYDTETSDADTTHGQILEFGAIHADPETLEELEAVELDIRLLPYIVPSPEAIEVCGYALDDLINPSRLDETTAARSMAKVLRPGRGPKLQATWNGLKFDSPILRMTMWRNLLDPWITSGAKVRQLDVMTLARLGHFIDPSIVTRGRKADGEPSWRLQDVAPANGIELKAHRAVNDSRGTLAIMRQVVERSRSLFSSAIQRGDGQYISKIADPSLKQALYLFTSFGEPRFEPVLPLSISKGQVVAARLNGDVAALFDGDIDAVRATLFKADGPCCTFKPNASPMLFTATEASAIGLPVEGHDSLTTIVEALRSSRAADTARQAQEALTYDPPIDTPEARIYEKFASYADKGLAESLHVAMSNDAPNVNLIKIIHGIADTRMREMASRLLLVHHNATPEQFTEAIGPQHGPTLEALGRRALSRPFAGDDAAWMTVSKAMAAGTTDFMTWLDGRYEIPKPPPASDLIPEPPTMPGGQMSFGF